MIFMSGTAEKMSEAQKAWFNQMCATVVGSASPDGRTCFDSRVTCMLVCCDAERK